MRGGALDRVITLQVEASTKDAATGQTKFTFTTVGNFAANLKPVKMGEAFDMGTSGGNSSKVAREIAKEVYIFTIRYFTGLTVRHRIIYDGRVFDIVGIHEEGKRRWWKIRGESIGATP